MIWSLTHNGIAIALIESKSDITIGRIANANIDITLINGTKKRLLK